MGIGFIMFQQDNICTGTGIETFPESPTSSVNGPPWVQTCTQTVIFQSP